MATLRKRVVNNNASFGLAHFDNNTAGDIQAVALVDSSGNELTGAGISGSDTPTEANVSLIIVDTEYSYAIPSGTKSLQFQCRQDRDIRFSFTTGKVAGPTSPYQTLKAGQTYYQDFLSLTGKTIYFATGANAGDVVEVLTWQ